MNVEENKYGFEISDKIFVRIPSEIPKKEPKKC